MSPATTKRRQQRRSAIFLDRDGVLNHVTVVDGVPRPPRNAAELRLLPGVADACRQLRATGYVLVVVSNQPDIARATATVADVEAINAHLREQIPLDDVLVCPHDDSDRCVCRKPSAGLLLLAAKRWGIDLTRSVMVGDRWKDIEAGRKAGCATVFVDRGYAERAPGAPDHIAKDLPTAVAWILANHPPTVTEAKRAHVA